MTDEQMEDYLDKVSKQKTAYKELDKFEPGQGGLQYFPVPVEEHAAWKKEKAKKDMEAYEKQQKHKLDVLALRDELTRSNGHDKPQVTLYEGHPSLTTCKYCNNTVGQCNCKENPKYATISKDKDEKLPTLKMPGKQPLKITEEQIKDKTTAAHLKEILNSGSVLSDTIVKKYPNVKKAATFQTNNPDLCDLKKEKKTTRKRVSKKK